MTYISAAHKGSPADPMTPAALPVAFPRPATLATFLRADHDELAVLTESVMRTIVAGDQAEVAAAIAGLQARVLAHLDGEERDLFPGYAQYAPHNASELLADHGKIRRALAELDVTVDLHLVRADAIKAFLATLRKHAIEENAGLYRWAAQAQDA